MVMHIIPLAAWGLGLPLHIMAAQGIGCFVPNWEERTLTHRLSNTTVELPFMDPDAWAAWHLLGFSCSYNK